MSALHKPSPLDAYREHLSNFHEIEDFMGEVAELVSHIADALSHHPDDIDLSPGAPASMNCLSLDEGDWPSFKRLQSMIQSWRVKRDALVAAWTMLSEAERAEAGSLPNFGAADPSRPMV